MAAAATRRVHEVSLPHFHICDRLTSVFFFYIYFNPISFDTTLIQKLFENRHIFFLSLLHKYYAVDQLSSLKVTFSSSVMKIQDRQTTKQLSIKSLGCSEYFKECVSFKSGN